jgi:hypothetical protein
MLPPGWMNAETPALSAISTQSGKGKNRIARHHRTVQVKAERVCLVDSLLQRIHPRSLPAAHRQQLPAFCEYYRIRLEVFGHLVGKHQILYLFGGRRPFGDGLQLFRRLYLLIKILCNHPVQQGFELPGREIGPFLFQQDAGSSFSSVSAGFRLKIRRNQHFKKQLVDFCRRRFVQCRIRNEYPAESRNWVGSQCGFPGLHRSRSGSHAAGVRMFQHRKGGFYKLRHQVYRRIDVHEVVVGQLLAVQDVKHFVDIAVEIALLVRVLAVAQCLSVQVTFLKRIKRGGTGEIAVNQGIIVGTDGKCLLAKCWRNSSEVCPRFSSSTCASSAYWLFCDTITVSLKFLAAARIREMPPISIFSMISEVISPSNRDV